MSEWIENEGAMPVDGDILVYVQLRSGVMRAIPHPAEQYDWEIIECSSDIVSYKLA